MGELNSSGGEEFEYKLREFFRLATTWKAVVLIDEADVFLEHRKSGAGVQAEKNAFVAVFLKHLEYFQGIIFLTSNRVDVFDAAVQSRIHLALQYSSPSVAVRLELWNQRLSSLGADQLDLDIDEVLSAVRQVEMNGREISNTLNTALTLARNAGGKLRLEHIESVVQVWKDFNESIKEMEQMRKTKPRQDSMVPSASWS
jgi:AAA+ superfamily predicted ATPase